MANIKSHQQRSFLILPLLFFSACTPRVSKRPVEKRLQVEGPGPRVAKLERPILIGLRVQVEEVTVKCEGKIKYENLEARKESVWVPGDYRFSGYDDRVFVEGSSRGKKVRLTPFVGDSFLQVNGKGYRGSIIVKAIGKKITVINELDVDDYLKGVLPREVVVTWPEESLRVQAVASRTYLAAHLNSHAADGFDMCADVHCQVYGGVSKEHPAASKAVDDTREEILTYEGKPIKAFFHSDCGGSTEQKQLVWGTGDEPYLPRKNCPYGTGDPRYHWRTALSDSAILSGLAKSTRVRGTTLKSIRIEKKSPSGRVQVVVVTTDEGSYRMMGNEFRLALNPEVIRSTLWTGFTRRRNGYEFSGRGWGHGVGMCQWGAKGQAERGRSYVEILKYYYPHSRLGRWGKR
ncbi:MAG: SpoIID/LytB domain-containing protein [Elusimicrobia bacterium]|nr:SpoIID/LytB domain-containing protein [Candidatus Obscuribacterium magneticum]